ncbi:sensor histidine kinase [Lignipirellula cremea]|uniref:histidine kinase n=1 Tax=Lignipirellula cremea TaxID=2528010 RepID=A0A518DQ65_9BACT|nr:ATP-binding protein [Lignipirellula cremea]QDU93971.1 Sensor protein ZraS [Lignipirellula cremea]
MTVDINWNVEMIDTANPVDLAAIDLETILAAWQTATERLQKTHEVLSLEVRRLSDELAVKNRELARQNRLADLGRAAAHVAHEVRNSLVPLTLDLSVLKRRVASEPANLELISHLETGFTEVEAAVNDMLHFTADRDPKRQPIDLAQLLVEICQALQPQFSAQQIEIEIDMPLDSMVLADREMLRRAVLNLVLNAVDAMPQGGELTICGCTTGAHFELEIADSGPGIPEDELRQLFEPFFTTKSNGSGLGLAIVNRIAAAHGGDVTVLNCPQGGAAFTVCLPLENSGSLHSFQKAA